MSDIIVAFIVGIIVGICSDSIGWLIGLAIERSIAAIVARLKALAAIVEKEHKE